MSGISHEYRVDGFMHSARSLEDAEVASAALRDTDLFAAEVRKIREANESRVPYIVTDAIQQVANDPALVRAVEEILGTDQWVMWGPNIREATPNAAHRWHVDLESFLWPSSLTVAVGLSGCSPEGATWFLPGTHSLASGPSGGEKAADTARVCQEAKSLGGRWEPVQISGFQDGGFYIFNARCWHRGDPTTSAGRVVLFLHYQSAVESRVPYMLDYRIHRWSREAAPFTPAPSCSRVEASVFRPPLKHRAGGWLKRLRR